MTGLPSLFSRRIWRNWLLGMSLMKIHRTVKMPFHLSCAQMSDLVSKLTPDVI